MRLSTKSISLEDLRNKLVLAERTTSQFYEMHNHLPDIIQAFEKGFMDGYETPVEKSTRSAAYHKSYQTGYNSYLSRVELNKTCDCGEDHRMTLAELKETAAYKMINMITNLSQDQLDGLHDGYQAAWDEDHRKIISKSI